MIYYDASEQSTKLPQDVIDYGVKFPDLERITGADFMVVPEEGNYEKSVKLQSQGKSIIEIAKELEIVLPEVVTLLNDPEKAILEWIFAGALLVQRKSDFDFVQSTGPRINDAIARMCEVAPKHHQRIILAVGVFERGKNGNLSINGNPTNWTWESYVGSVSALKYKGAAIEFLPSDDCILGWIKTQESQLLKYKRENTKWIVTPVYYPPDMPELDDPLQLMIPVRDARLTMVNIPGWGVEKVNALHKHVKHSLGIERHPNLLELLQYATSFETAKYIPGIGNKMIQNVRNYVGLVDGEYLTTSDTNFTIQRESVE